MTTIDLRGGAEAPVDKIIFGEEGESLMYNPDYTEVIDIVDGGRDVSIYMGDVPILILALQKALELWQPKK